MRINLAIAVAALVGSPAAWAQIEADTDGDGAISLDEFQAEFAETAERRFQALDDNGDGLVTAEEFRGGGERGERAAGFRSRMADRTLTRLDTDGDGFVTLAEVLADGQEATGEWFARRDADGDGQLSADEFSERRFGDRDRDGGIGRIDAEIDTDGDGAWSLAELQAVRPELTAERFNRLDDNGDGVVSADERSGRRGDFRNRRGR